MKDNKKLMLPILGLLAFMTNGDNYAAAPLLLKISEDLGVGMQQAAWSVTAYMLSFGLFTLIFGPLSDRFGKVRIIRIAAFGTAIFSIVGGFAFNLPSLILFRAINGAFAAGIFPVTLALIGQSFSDKERHGAIGKVMGLMFLGSATATAIGGALAYFGSWRLVYIVYGIAEFIIALVILKTLSADQGVVKKLNFLKAYKVPFSNPRFIRLVTVIFFVGFAVFGSYTYSGKLLQSFTDYSVMQVGLILSFFGVGTVLGSRIAPKVKKLLHHGFLPLAGVMGFAGLFSLSAFQNIYIICAGLFIFGLAFIFLQSSLVSTAQAKLPHMRGAAMSLASFNMFVGGAIGTIVNGKIMTLFGLPPIFRYASFVMLAVSILAAFFLAGFEKRQKLAMKNTQNQKQQTSQG